MHALKLTSNVAIRAPNLWGFKAELDFRPSPKPGWWWDTGKAVVPISPEIIGVQNYRMQLSYQGQKLEVYEHIGILRWFGLCDVIIRGNGWPPHYGCALKLWRAVQQYLRLEVSREIPWYTISKPVRWDYPEMRQGERAFTEIQPGQKPGIELEVTYSNPRIGRGTATIVLPDSVLLLKVCTYPSPDFSLRNYIAARIGKVFGWPNYDAVSWVRNYTPHEALRRFVLHRAADLLGALSPLCKDGLFAGKVISRVSGHKADVNVILQAQSLLEPLSRPLKGGRE